MRPLPVVAFFANVLLASSCGGAPVPAPEGATEERPAPARRSEDVPDDCAQLPGQPPPEPLAKTYEGVAAKARCQREVYTIMGGLTHFLGVSCEYCHIKDQYEQPTHRKAIANWMARELIPSLEKKGPGEIWCNDCHVVNGKGKAKILGSPRRIDWTVEWMTTHLTNDFQRSADHGVLRCKDCHHANLGSPEFQRRIILTDHLPPRPARPEPVEMPDAGAPDAVEAPADAGSDAAPEELRQ